MKRTPIARRTRLRQRRATPRRSGRVLDAEYRAWVKTLPCRLAALGACEGVTEADHAGVRPLGRKADDRTCIPMCKKHHEERTGGAGIFRAWTKAGARVWLDSAIAETQAKWLVMRALAGATDDETTEQPRSNQP